MTERPGPADPRQHVERIAGSRRARLTPVPGSDPEPESGPAETPPARNRPKGAKGPNDDQLLQDVPPHY